MRNVIYGRPLRRSVSIDIINLSINVTVLPALGTKILSEFFIDDNDADSKSHTENKFGMLFFSIDLILTHITILTIFDNLFLATQTKLRPGCDVT